jgi:tetratricopeptide (TPR) repeat protein
VVHGDLDWIAMKCLAKERGRRYETANGLALDIRRYLADEPVLAGPPSAGYRLRKFARRNKRALATTALLGAMLLIAVGAVAGSLGWTARDRAARLARRAEEVQGIVNEAQTLGDRAVTLIDDNQDQWEATLSAARSAISRAEILADSDRNALDPALLNRLEAVRSRLEADEKDYQFIARLDELRLEATQMDFGKFDDPKIVAAIKDLFQTNGIGYPVTPPDQVAAHIRQRPAPVQKHFVGALDAWRFFSHANDPAEWQWLTAALEAADDNPWRRKARRAWAENNWLAINDLTRDLNEIRQSPAFLLALAWRMPNAFDSTRFTLFRQLQAAYPGDFWVNYFLAVSLLNTKRQENMEEAARYFTAASALRPRLANVRRGLGTALARRGNLEGAIAAYQQALALDPNSASTKAGLDRALKEKVLRDAVATDSNDAEAQLRLGQALGAKGDLEGAIIAYQRALALNPNSTSARSDLEHVVKVKRLADAVARNPRDAAAHFELGTAYDEKRNLTSAIASYRKAIEIDPKLVAARTALGYALYRSGNAQAAIAEYRKVIEIDPKYSPAYRNLGATLCQTGDVAGGANVLRAAVERIPTDAHACYLSAQAHLSAGDHTAYRQVCSDMLKRFGRTKDPTVADWLLNSFLTTPNTFDDMGQLLPLAELAATNKADARLLGAALYRAGKYDAAIEPLERGQSRAWDHLFLAMAHHRLGQADKAREYLERATDQIKAIKYPWPENMKSELLRREAEALIWGAGIDRSPPKK